MVEMPRLYSDLSEWWPVLSEPEDYAEEAEFYRKTLVSACARSPQTVLELGSGGGNNASHLKAYFQLTLVDLSEGMLAVSRELNPELEHLNGDMRTVRLERLFDAVFVHDAVSYMTNQTDLRKAMETAYAHCREGGAAIFCPDYVLETFRSGTKTGGHDGAGRLSRRSLRYLEWTWDPEPQDETYVVDFAYLLREGGQMRCEYDRHIFGLFSRHDWIRLLGEVGFRPYARPFEHSELEPGSTEIFIGEKRASK
jgi:SAM-dependent methyltransferase